MKGNLVEVWCVKSRKENFDSVIWEAEILEEGISLDSLSNEPGFYDEYIEKAGVEGELYTITRYEFHAIENGEITEIIPLS